MFTRTEYNSSIVNIIVVVVAIANIFLIYLSPFSSSSLAESTGLHKTKDLQDFYIFIIIFGGKTDIYSAATTSCSS